MLSSTAVTDFQEAGRSGCNTDFLRLLLASQPKIRSLIYSLIARWSDVDEIYQETSIVLWQKFDQFEQGTDFSAWACQIARNKVLNYRRRQASAALVFSETFIEAVTERRMARNNFDQRSEALAGCRDKLSARDRELIDRCYCSTTTAKQVAEELSRPVDTIYKSLKRIRETLYLCVQRTLSKEDL